MTEHRDDWFYAIKGAQKDLIKHAGGIVRAAVLCDLSKSEMGRFNRDDTPDIMPANVVRILERETHRQFFTSVMAHTAGCRLTDPDEERSTAACIMTSHAELKIYESELDLEMARGMADGHLSATELAIADKKAAALQNKLADFRANIAGGMAKGGIKAGLRVVGGE